MRAATVAALPCERIDREDATVTSAVRAEAIESSESTRLCLVADLGGTNARFALAHMECDKATNPVPRLRDAQNFRVGDFATLADAITQYLQQVDVGRAPEAAVLAVACPITGDTIRFTNNGWNFSIRQLQRELGFRDLQLVNDFAAVAWAVPVLTAGESEPVGRSGPLDTGGDGTRVVLGPGTGLGLAAVKMDRGEATVLETEGGHIGFAPRSEHEMFLLQHLIKRYGRVSYERLLCGDGLLNLYGACCAAAGSRARCESPEQVSQAAAGGEPMAAAAVADFCSILGAYAGDAALICGAWSGVYLAGGLLPHVLDADGSRRFRESFEDKGRFSGLLRRTPALRITRRDVGLLGAAAYGIRTLGGVESPADRTHAPAAQRSRNDATLRVRSTL